MSATVIDFNSAKAKKVLKDLEEAAEVDELQDQAISVMVMDIVTDVIDFLLEQDIDVRDDPMTIYDILLLHEVLKALVYRAMKEEYPIQGFAEALMTIDDPLKSLNDFLDLTDE
jgi:hypothetical protein